MATVQAIGPIEEPIQKLPTEHREKILKELVSIKIRERNAPGWDVVNQVIREAPLCHKRERITRILVSSKYEPCSFNGLRDLC